MPEDYFIKFKDVEGEATAENHDKDIEVDEFGWEEHQKGSADKGGGSSAGKVDMQSFWFKAQTNKASPVLMQACAAGTGYDEVKFACRKSCGKNGQQDYIIWTFTGAMITHFKIGAPRTDGDGQVAVVPQDEVRFTFKTVKFEYKPQKADQSLDAAVPGGWDREKNKAL
jgi:type VI secretion system secreted protein Hcp